MQFDISAYLTMKWTPGYETVTHCSCLYLVEPDRKMKLFFSTFYTTRFFRFKSLKLFIIHLHKMLAIQDVVVNTKKNRNCRESIPIYPQKKQRHFICLYAHTWMKFKLNISHNKQTLQAYTICNENRSPIKYFDMAFCQRAGTQWLLDCVKKALWISLFSLFLPSSVG